MGGEKNKYNEIEISCIGLGYVGRFFGLGALVRGLLLYDGIEGITGVVAGIGIYYAGQSLHKLVQDNANAREQTKVLRGIEKALQNNSSD